MRLNFSIPLFLGLALQPLACGQSQTPVVADSVPITIGRSVVALNGPWKFHIGDGPGWADPNFDDSDWETMDLTPPPGAHDADVGLSGYVPGWEARGHAGYWGFAWYRLRVSVSSPQGDRLALAGPPAVDSAYQVFLNGQLLGSAGNFSGSTPTAYSIQPRMFPLPQSVERAPSRSGGSAVLAFRTWMGPWELGDPEAGGIHIAPALGEAPSIKAHYRIQWLETVSGYIVEVVEALLFVLLAVMACSLIAFDPKDRAYLWLAAAMMLIGLYRANQAVFFWGQFETVHGFELVSIVLLIPLALGAWTLAWCAWFKPYDLPWMPPIAGALTLLYMGAQFLSRSWFYGLLPHAFAGSAHFVATYVRLVFVLLMLIIVCRGIRQQGREGWLALPAVLLVSVGLFAQELSELHIPGIWFPFGTGVSRTQFAYAAFDVAIFALLLRRLLGFAKRGTGSRREAGIPTSLPTEE